ncbi:hypothetical protein D3C73_1070240 [compost metagenome]
MLGRAAGIISRKTCCSREYSRTCATSYSLRSTLRTPAKVLTYSGKKEPSAISRTCESWPTPNQRINSGMTDKSGTVRSICRDGSTSSSNCLDKPVASPITRASEPPRAKPAAARITLASRWVSSLPLSVSFMNCRPISHGAGSRVGEIAPAAAAACHSSRTASGKNQACSASGNLPGRAGFFR